MIFFHFIMGVFLSALLQGCGKRPSQESIDKILLDISQGNCSELVDFYRFYRRCSRPSIFTFSHGRVKGCDELQKMESSPSGFLVLSIFSSPASFKECGSDQDFLTKINLLEKKGARGYGSTAHHASSSIFQEE